MTIKQQTALAQSKVNLKAVISAFESMQYQSSYETQLHNRLIACMRHLDEVM